VSETIYAALIGVIGALGGSLTGAWFGAYLTRRATYHLALRESFAKFASGFTEELIELKTTSSTEEGVVVDLLESAYQKHLRAYLELYAMLSGRQRRTLEIKWKTYKQERSDGTPEAREALKFSQYLPDYYEDISVKKQRAIQHIESLLDFDDYT
jgi:hypothetical protein